MTTRCGYVALLGAPNAGKSTLLNRMAGAKLSIVSPKAQTTRFRVLGIVARGESQILLVDTPGIFRPRRRLDRAMVDAAWGGVADADLSARPRGCARLPRRWRTSRREAGWR
jgi:GTP-binding protein Era